ncbi:MAG: TonB family protein [Bacteroidota bacterium]
MMYLRNWEDPTNNQRNEIVFAGRNHYYGAYVIRKNYNNMVLKAFFTTITFVTGIFTAPFIYNMYRTAEIVKPVIDPGYTIREIVFEEKKNIVEPLKQKPAEQQKIIPEHTDAAFTNVVAIDSVITTRALTQDELNALNTGARKDTTDGKETRITPALTDTSSGDSYNSIVGFADTMPMFPGGQDALIRYLSSHIKYPVEARMKDIKGTVYINFVIDKTGAVSSAEVQRGVGGGCDEEALKVIREMPSWSPGMQNHHPVNVRFVLPVKFSLQ